MDTVLSTVFVLAFIDDFLEALGKWLEDLITALKCMLIEYFEAIVQAYVDILTPLLDKVVAAMPDASTSINDAQGIMAHANYFVPLDFGFTLLAAWLTFQAGFLAIKLPIKLFVPTVG